MKTYKVYVNWEVTGTIDIKAPSANDAEELARTYLDKGLVPIEYEAVQGCAQVLYDATEDLG